MVTMGRFCRFVAFAVVGIAALAAPATAQTPGTDTTTTTSPTTLPDTTTSTTVITGGDAPPASVPDVPITVPPRDPPEGVAPQPGRVVAVNLRGARASALARQAAYTEAVALRTQLEQNLTLLQNRI